MILLLRAELADLLEFTTKLGIAPVILKGGSVVHDDTRALRAKDLDLLLPPDQGRALADALDRGGWRAVATASPLHLAERARPGRPPIEIHTTDGAAGPHLGAAAFARARTHPVIPGLRVLHPDDQVRHVALHQTIDHPAYRGRLRDLLLLADALGDATGDDPLDRWPVAPAQRPAVATTLALASSIRAHDGTGDPAREMAAAWYHLEAAQGPARAGLLTRLETIWAYQFLADDGSAWELWRRSWGPRLGDDDPLPFLLRAIALPPVILAGRLRAVAVRRRVAATLALLDQRS